MKLDEVSDLKATYLMLVYAKKGFDANKPEDVPGIGARIATFFSTILLRILPICCADRLIRALQDTKFRNSYLFPCMKEAVTLFNEIDKHKSAACGDGDRAASAEYGGWPLLPKMA